MTATSEPLSDSFGYGVAASRPAAGIVGRVYYASDTAVFSRDNGTSWDTIPLGGGGSEVAPRCIALPTPVASAGPISFSFAGAAPDATHKLFASIGMTANATTVTSITQTNVTWTQLHTFLESASGGTRVDLWMGTPSGTPGTTGSIAFAGSSNMSATIWQWPAALTGTYTGVDTSGGGSPGTRQTSGIVTPPAHAMVVSQHCCNNGTTGLQAYLLTPYMHQIGAGVQNFAACAVGEASGAQDYYSHVEQQTNSYWANFIGYVV